MGVSKYAVILTLLTLTAAPQAKSKPGKAAQDAKAAKDTATATGTPVLRCRSDADIPSLDLSRGPVTDADLPQGPVTFVEEDMDGSNPKFDVSAADGVEWKVKMGEEARPEAATDHLLWAMGYCVTEDAFVPVLTVNGLPEHLKRGQNLIGVDGKVHGVRLKRVPDGKKIGTWRWAHNPFVGTRDLNGLRVLMAVVGNWDLKTENNSIYAVRGDTPGLEYMVTDLGSSFGTDGQFYSGLVSKGNPDSYQQARFLLHVAPNSVSFALPSMPPVPLLFVFPNEVRERITMRGVTRNIPRDDAAWITGLLAQLSRQQIEDIFRGAGYGPGATAEFADTLQARIQDLQQMGDKTAANH